MSDFDKEAERERLREKYEQEQTKREATERMSELLLQGATMTNAHCSDCGDPIFRYDGQEFCATCEKAIDRGDEGADGTDSAGEAATDDGDEERIEVATPSEETRVQFGGDADGQPAGPDRGAADGTEDGEDEPEDPPRERVESTRVDRERAAPSRADHEHADRTQSAVPSVDPGSRQPDSGAGLAEARESLARTLAQLTRRAEAAENPTQAREYLEAAREAAEALAALRR